MELHAGGKQAWNNNLIVGYLEACPLPAAQKYLQLHAPPDASQGSLTREF